MIHKRKSSGGFSLVELMVSMLALTVVSLTIGSVLTFAWKGWYRANDAVELQRDASLAMRMIAKEIRASDENDIEVGSYLKCSNATFTKSGNNLTYKGMNIIDGWLSSFSTTSNAASVTVQLILKSPSDEAKISATYYTRN